MVRASQKRAPLGATAAQRKKKTQQTRSAMIEKRPKNFRIGGDIQPKRDVHRFVLWPKYVRLQRMKKIMLMRLKVPPAVNQFNHALDKNQAMTVLRLLKKYRPEARQDKKLRLNEMAQKKKDGEEEIKSKKPVVIKFGLNHVTTLVETKAAKLVVIAHDVDPIETVCWLPALCRKKDVPYCIIKGQGRLGPLVHLRSTACVALTSVKQEDKSELDALCVSLRPQFNDNVELRRKWGGGIMGIKSQHVTQRREKLARLEQIKKMDLAIG